MLVKTNIIKRKLEIMNFFDIYFVEPLFNALIFLYNSLPLQDIGLATIVLTAVIRLILFPFFQKSAKQQLAMNKIQPELQKIQKEYKDDKEKQVKAQMELYKKYKVNPFGGCLIALIQLPILLAVYRMFLNGFSPDKLATLYDFIQRPEAINEMFLGLVNMFKPNIWLAILSAYLQFVLSKMMLPAGKKGKKDAKTPEGPEKIQKITGMFQKQMVFIAPIMTLVVLVPLPSILAVYWVTTTVFSIIQQWMVKKQSKSSEPGSAKIVSVSSGSKKLKSPSE